MPRLFSNTIAALIMKPASPDELHPWLKMEGGRIVPDPDWYARKYG